MAAIVTGEILFKYSTTAGAAGNTTTSTAAASLGKYLSTSAWGGSVANDLFDDVTGAENAANAILDYRCIFVHNTNTLNDLQNAVVYMSAETAGGATIAIAVDTTPTSAKGSASAQALGTSGNTEIAPGAPVVALSYSSPTTAPAGLALGTIPKDQVKAFWVRRTTTNSSALSNDGVTIAVAGDTGSL